VSHRLKRYLRDGIAAYEVLFYALCVSVWYHTPSISGAAVTFLWPAAAMALIWGFLLCRGRPPYALFLILNLLIAPFIAVAFLLRARDFHWRLEPDFGHLCLCSVQVGALLAVALPVVLRVWRPCENGTSADAARKEGDGPV
jgi:hypothetical protein